MVWFWSRGWIGISSVLWVLGTGSLALAVAQGASPYILAIASPSVILVALVIGIRRPEVKVGQLLAVSGGAFACSIALLPLAPDGRSVGDTVLVASHLVNPIAVVALIGALLVFPDGQLRSPRWRWIAASLAILLLDGIGGALAVLAVVDRRFFRTRYQSQEVFDGFARRLRARNLVGTDAIEGDILAVLEETLAPQRAGVWIRPS